MRACQRYIPTDERLPRFHPFHFNLAILVFRMKAKNAFLAISDKRGTTTTPPERHCKYKEKNLTSQIIYLKKQNNPLVVTDTT